MSEALWAPGCDARARQILPSEYGYCAVIEGFLSAAECRSYIDLAEHAGFGSAQTDYPPTYRTNDRLVLDDESLAARLFARLRSAAPHEVRIEAASGAEHWRLDGMNARMRFCRYQPGQQFNIHQDGVHHRARDWRSLVTFMIYLTDGAAFTGGDTVFFEGGPDQARTGEALPRVIARVRPKAGTLILFDHALWHAGETVHSGTKHVMRSDLLYRRVDSSNAREAASGEVAHAGYVWTLARLADGSMASGGRDRRIRIWAPNGTYSHELLGHTQSVLGLAQIDAASLASVSRDRTLKLWDLTERRCLHSITAHDAAVLCVTQLADNSLATGSADHRIAIWDRELRRKATLSGHTGWVWKLAPLGNELLASAAEDGTVRLWNWVTERTLAVLPGDQPLRTIAISPDREWLVTGDVLGHLRIWTDCLSTPRLAANFSAHRAAIRCLEFLDDHTLASGGEDNCVRVWDRLDWRSISVATHENFVTDIVGADGGYVSASYDGRIVRHAQRLGALSRR